MAEQTLIPRRRRPEVLAPAGNMNAFHAAVDFGADAVYCSGKLFGMRSAPRNFTLDELAEAAVYAHRVGARVYVTCNILPTNPEIDGIRTYLTQLDEAGVDAVIVTDIGVMMMAREVAPRLEIHISTQAGVTNYLAAQTLYKLGAKRVVLARELALEDVATIRRNTPDDLDIECFVHGSMCMAFSGRCLISNFLTGRSGNHGECAQPCRWKYTVMEEKRPGQYFPIEETKDGAYLFNSRDMNMLDHIGEVIDAGASSLKIEGRAKSAYYVAAMTNAYKCAVNEYLTWRDGDGAGQPASAFHPSAWLSEETFKVSHRDYCTGFWYRDVPAGQSVTRGGYHRDWIVTGDVLGWETGRVRFIGRNKITAGQHIEILQPACPPLSLTVSDDIRDEAGVYTAVANNPTHIFTLPCPTPVVAGSVLRTRALAPTLKAA